MNTSKGSVGLLASEGAIEGVVSARVSQGEEATCDWRKCERYYWVALSSTSGSERIHSRISSHPLGSMR